MGRGEDGRGTGNSGGRMVYILKLNHEKLHSHGVQIKGKRIKVNCQLETKDAHLWFDIINRWEFIAIFIIVEHKMINTFYTLLDDIILAWILKLLSFTSLTSVLF